MRKTAEPTCAKADFDSPLVEPKVNGIDSPKIVDAQKPAVVSGPYFHPRRRRAKTTGTCHEISKEPYNLVDLCCHCARNKSEFNRNKNQSQSTKQTSAPANENAAPGIFGEPDRCRQVAMRNSYSRWFGRGLIVVFSSLIPPLLGFCSQAIAARMLGPAFYGIYNHSIAIISLALPLAVLGAPSYILMAFGERSRLDHLTTRLPLAIAVSSTIMTAVIIGTGAGFILMPDEASVVRLLLPWLVCSSFCDIARTKAQIEDNFIVFSIWTAIPSSVRFAGVIFSLLSCPSLGCLAQTIGTLSAVAVLVASSTLRKIYNGKTLPFRQIAASDTAFTRDIQESLKRMLYYAVGGLLYQAFYLAAIVILGFIRPRSDVAQFAAAYVFLNAVLIFPNAVFNKLLMPRLQLWSHHDRKKLVRFSKLSVGITNVVAPITALIFYLIVPHLLALVYGSNYWAAHDIARVLSLAIWLRLSSAGISGVLNTGPWIEAKTRLMAVCALIGICGNYLLISFFGVIGAAWATVLTEFVFCIGMYMLARRSLYDA